MEVSHRRSSWMPRQQPSTSAFALAALLTALLVTESAAAQQNLAQQLEAVAAPEFRDDGPGGVALLARNGEIVFLKAYGMAQLELGVPMRTDHVFKIASITKQFTAIAVLQLVSEGKIRLGQDIRELVPSIDTQGNRITVEQLLTHTSGLPNLVDLPDFPALMKQDHSIEELLALTNGIPLHFQPGTSFRYSDTGYILLGALIERVSGLSYADYIETKIFRPLGMFDSYYADDTRILPRLVQGYSIQDGKAVHAPYISMTVPQAAGGLASTAQDLLRWQLALRSGSVLPDALLKQAWTPPRLPDGTRSGYGFGFKLCSLEGSRTIEHGGFIYGFLANALQLPDQKLDVIVLINNDSDAPDAGKLARRMARLALSGRPKPQYQALSPQQRSALAGRYQFDSGRQIEFADRDGALWNPRGDGSRIALGALSPTELSPSGTEGALIYRFAIGPDGQAKELRSRLRCEPVGRAVRVEGKKEQGMK